MSFISFCIWIVSRFSEIKYDAPVWYSVIWASFFLLWLLLRGLYRLMTSGWHSTSFFILKHFVYPHLLPKVPFLGTATRFQIIATTLYLAANVLFVALPKASWAEAGARAATMSIINLVPLLCGPRICLMTKVLGISLQSSLGSHRWVGRTTIALAMLHMIVSLKEGGRFTWTSGSASGAVASSALGLIFILSIRLMRSLQYETFLNSHLILALVALIAIWCHIPEKKAATLFLQFGVCLWVAMSMVHWCLFVFRNFVFGRAFATAVVKPLSNQRKPGELDPEQAMQVDVSNEREIDPEEIMQVDITIPRPWRVRAGQHIFISIPKLGILRGLRGHPFVITWWDRDITGLTVTLLIKSRTGFTRELRRHVEKPLRVFVDGPFGIRHDFGDYGTVVMVATGIGIAGHIPYLKELISGYNSCEVKTRRILLIWETQRECQQQWVKKWMDQILAFDTGVILEISLHAQEYGKKDEAYGSHDKLNKSFGPLDVEGLLQKELGSRRGRIIVSLCAEAAVADRARAHVQARMDERVRLVELDFQPSQCESLVTDTAEMEFACRG